jgi:DNA-binding transcriptional regulator GbsR (MarR family)
MKTTTNKTQMKVATPHSLLSAKPLPLSAFPDDEDTAVHAVESALDFGSGNLEAMEHVCEAMGQIMECWGFKKIMGMTWAFLYLCPEPASAKDICQALKISPALASITLQELLRWEVVKKLSPMGKRRDYYVAEHDIWKMIRKVFRERERAQIEKVEQKLEIALAALDNEKESRPDLKSKRTCQFQRLRIEDLMGVTEMARQLMESFLSDAKVDISPIFSALKPYTIHAGELKT